MSVFPPEIINDILLRLPPKDLIRSTCVSKGWHALIHDRRFINDHLQRSVETNSSSTILVGSCTGYAPSKFFSLPFNDDGGKDSTAIGTPVEIDQPLKDPAEETIMLGNSVNGLVCIRNDDDGRISLWNPSVQRFKTIPSSSTADLEQQRQSPPYLEMFGRFGFGYESGNDDYKVVDFAGLVDEDDVTVNYQVNVYSLKSNSWKTIQNNMPCDGFRFLSDEMLCLNGALSWLIGFIDYNNYVVVTLDLATEKYREFPTPIDGVNDSAADLKVLGGSLCIFVNRYGAPFTVWIMTEYGVAESWRLVFYIEQSFVRSGFPYCYPLVLSDNGEMLLLKQYHVDRDRLLWYDLEKKRVTQVETRGLPNEFNATICAGSLCLLDGDPVVAERQHRVNHLRSVSI